MSAKTPRRRLRRYKVAVIGRFPAPPAAFGTVTVRAKDRAEANRLAPIAAAIRRADLGLSWETA